MRLNNKVVLITASTRGIGLACVKACAAEGAIVYMGARNGALADEIAKKLDPTGMKVKTVFNDATKHETYSSMIDAVVKNEGHIDVLVNNFGTSDPQKDLTVPHTTYEYFKETVFQNLASVYLSSQAAIPHMAANGGGSIVNISSIGGLVPDISRVAYGTSKGAINYLTKNIAVQEARSHIRCNAVLPGMTETDSVKTALSDDFKAFFLRHSPIKRMAKPEEIASAVLYFASDESAFTTGQILAVSGGFGLATPIFGDIMEQKSQPRP